MRAYQRPGECVLAAVCALYGRDYHAESARFRAWSGVPWGALRQPPDNLLWLLYLSETMHPEFASEKWFPLLATDVQTRVACPTETIRRAERGIIGVACVSGQMPMGHALAFDGQTVFDPQDGTVHENIETLLQLPSYRGWHVALVIPLAR